ncbi:polyketide cyclase [Siphonobacter sp. SORGH_AS_0500]|uniref:SRPBCC family protein n=1 Tax=Siphonobacter sp. SORGH_AS_0500 TaxID=1864824 RepID=UPI000CBB7A62|nr:SRPBCC family protein [Siphonobacter sp. SORGH_AS_0500]PKK37153.1 polyketide cyclase [Siphonobacter sp. SORGH_AS_0500]
MATFEKITIETLINAPVEKVWKLWSEPEHIMQWNTASEDWHTTQATNDLRTSGTFSSRMEAKDGSFGFDFSGTYTEVIPQSLIAYVLGDERTVTITFSAKGDQTLVVETFDAETTNPVAMQQEGWQRILDNFKKYAEHN